MGGKAKFSTFDIAADVNVDQVGEAAVGNIAAIQPLQPKGVAAGSSAEEIDVAKDSLVVHHHHHHYVHHVAPPTEPAAGTAGLAGSASADVEAGNAAAAVHEPEKPSGLSNQEETSTIISVVQPGLFSNARKLNFAPAGRSLDLDTDANSDDEELTLSISTAGKDDNEEQPKGKGTPSRSDTATAAPIITTDRARSLNSESSANESLESTEDDDDKASHKVSAAAGSDRTMDDASDLMFLLEIEMECDQVKGVAMLQHSPANAAAGSDAQLNRSHQLAGFVDHRERTKIILIEMMHAFCDRPADGFAGETAGTAAACPLAHPARNSDPTVVPEAKPDHAHAPASAPAPATAETALDNSNGIYPLAQPARNSDRRIGLEAGLAVTPAPAPAPAHKSERAGPSSVNNTTAGLPLIIIDNGRIKAVAVLAEPPKFSDTTQFSATEKAAQRRFEAAVADLEPEPELTGTGFNDVVEPAADTEQQTESPTASRSQTNVPEVKGPAYPNVLRARSRSINDMFAANVRLGVLDDPIAFARADTVRRAEWFLPRWRNARLGKTKAKRSRQPTKAFSFNHEKAQLAGYPNESSKSRSVEKKPNLMLKPAAVSDMSSVSPSSASIKVSQKEARSAKSKKMGIGASFTFDRGSLTDILQEPNQVSGETGEPSQLDREYDRSSAARTGYSPTGYEIYARASAHTLDIMPVEVGSADVGEHGEYDNMNDVIAMREESPTEVEKLKAKASSMVEGGTTSKALFKIQGHCLSISGLAVRSIPRSIAKIHGRHVQHLDVSHGRLCDFAVLEAFPKLETLLADHNSIASLDTFPALTTLKALSVRFNQIGNVQALVDAAQKKFPVLESLNLIGNECCLEGNIEASSERLCAYRQTIIKRLPALKELNGMPVTKEELAVMTPARVASTLTAGDVDVATAAIAVASKRCKAGTTSHRSLEKRKEDETGWRTRTSWFQRRRTNPKEANQGEQASKASRPPGLFTDEVEGIPDAAASAARKLANGIISQDEYNQIAKVLRMASAVMVGTSQPTMLLQQQNNSTATADYNHLQRLVQVSPATYEEPVPTPTPSPSPWPESMSPTKESTLTSGSTTIWQQWSATGTEKRKSQSRLLVNQRVLHTASRMVEFTKETSDEETMYEMVSRPEMHVDTPASCTKPLPLATARHPLQQLQQPSLSAKLPRLSRHQLRTE